MKPPFIVLALCTLSSCVLCNCSPAEPAESTDGSDASVEMDAVVEMEAPCQVDNSAPDGEQLKLPVYNIQVGEHSWDRLHDDVFADVEVDATVCVHGREYPIELEIQGASSRSFEKKSFKWKFNRGRSLKEDIFGDGSVGFRKVILKAMFKDRSMIREGVSFDLLSEMGLDAPRLSYANLSVNGEYWGLYVVVEPVDPDYIQRLGFPPAGPLYKAVRKHGELADFSPGRDLSRAFESKNYSPSESWSDLEGLVKQLQETPATEQDIREVIDPRFPLDQYYDRMIWVSYTQNTDAIAQNFFLYGDPRKTPMQWRLFAWDSDIALSNHWKLSESLVPPEDYPLLDGGNFFSRRLLSVDRLKQDYIARFQRALTEVFRHARVHAILDSHISRVKQDIRHDYLRWNRGGDEEEEFEEIRHFLDTRPSTLLRLLENTQLDSGN